MKKIILTTICVTLLNFALTFTAFANNSSSTPAPDPSLSEATFNVKNYLRLPGEEDQPAKYYENKKEGPIVAFILTVMNYATAIIGSIAIILLIVAGLWMMLSQGNQQALDKAKEIVKYALIGLIITFLSYIIVIFVQSIFVGK